MAAALQTAFAGLRLKASIVQRQQSFASNGTAQKVAMKGKHSFQVEVSQGEAQGGAMLLGIYALRVPVDGRFRRCAPQNGPCLFCSQRRAHEKLRHRGLPCPKVAPKKVHAPPPLLPPLTPASFLYPPPLRRLWSATMSPRIAR